MVIKPGRVMNLWRKFRTQIVKLSPTSSSLFPFSWWFLAMFHQLLPKTLVTSTGLVSLETLKGVYVKNVP